MSRKFEYVNRILSNGYQTLNPTFKLPERSTSKAAGYDFYNPKKVILEPRKIQYVKTGVKAKMQDDEVLLLYNRSSNPKKKNLVLMNGVGVIDADYYSNEDNDGEIAFAFMNISDEDVVIEQGEKLGQGIFTKYLLSDNDNAREIRTGGFGSTGK